MIKGSSKSIGLSVDDIIAEGDIEILGIDRAGTYLTRPRFEEKIAEGDRLLVYGNRKLVKQILD
jgi:Trk K+ transport system NAD-binding subunit